MSRNKTQNGPTFSTKTRQCLHAAGWAPDRRIRIDKYETAFAEEQIELSSKVRSFLTRFGGLIIPYKNQSQQDDTLDFLADEAVEGLGHGALRSYEDGINAGGLSPLGYYGSGTCLVLMTSEGKVYSGVDFTIYYIGSSGSRAIENIVAGKRLEKISESKTTRQG